MIIDLREVKDAPLKDHDLVIVDTGPADGASMTWAGLSSPLDEIDLARHLSSTLKASI